MREDEKNNCFRRALEEETGQSMVFGAVTFFVLACFIAIAYNVGDVTSRKIQIQGAADAAAYAGAQVEANSLNTMAWVNDGMAFIYYNLMRYSVDHITFGTLAKFKDSRSGAGGASDEVIGISDAQSKADEAKKIAEEWIPKGQAWLKQLGELSRGIAYATPWLVYKEVIEVARANGAHAVAVWPEKFRFYHPANPNRGGSRSNKNAYFEYETKDFFDKKGVQGKFIKKFGGFPDWWKTGGAKSGGRGFRIEPAGFDRRKTGRYGYYQIRDCWHPKDLSHGGRDEQDHLGPQVHIHRGSGFPNIKLPAGHWHRRHLHLIRIETPFGTIYWPVFHTDGHFTDQHSPSRDRTDIPPQNLLPHHAKRTCDNCYNYDWDGKVKKGRLWKRGMSDVLRAQGELRDTRELQFVALPDIPFRVKKKIFEDGINVLVWRKKSSQTLLGSVYKNPNQGFFAFARGEIGYYQGSNLVTGQLPDRKYNLYENIEFGARLGPLPQNDKKAKDILQGLRSAMWFELKNGPSQWHAIVKKGFDNRRNGKLFPRGKRYLQELGHNEDQPLEELRKYIHH